MTEADGSMASSRLPFERRGFFLIDPPDVDTRSTIHVSLLGESVSERDRAELIESVRSGSRMQQDDAIRSLWRDRSPEYLDALLDKLGGERPELANVILRFAEDDPRVRPALIQTLLRTPIEDCRELAHAVGLAGGDDALAALRIRFHELISSPRDGLPMPPGLSATSDDDRVALVLPLSHAILRLDRDATDAAEQMIRLYHRTSRADRWSVVEPMTEILLGDLKTTASMLFRQELDQLVEEGRDLDSQLVAARVLARDHFETIYARCVAALGLGGSFSRERAVMALASMPMQHAGRSISTVARWLLESDLPVRKALWVASFVHDLLPTDFAAAIVEECLMSRSPSLRFEATRYVEHVTAEPRLIEPLRAAAEEDPDPMLRREMSRVVAAVELLAE